MNSLHRRYHSAQPDPGELMPPNLEKTVTARFGDPERSRLTAWLREAGWPQGHMEIPELEGYLVALIAWPVGIAPGAWLPRIWGERGWKVPTKIAARARYDEFVFLIIGFLRQLDHELSRQPPRFESTVLRGLRGRQQMAGLHHWGRGFLTALTLGSQGLQSRNASAGSAVRIIATVTSSSTPFRAQAVDEIMDAVFALMSQRVSRGPLGPLEAQDPMPGWPNPPGRAVEPR